MPQHVPGPLGQQVLVLLDVVVLLAVRLLAVHDIAVIVAHGAGSLEEGPGRGGALEAIVGRHGKRVHLHPAKVGKAKVLRPGVVPETLVAHLLGLLKRRVLGDGRIGAVALDEAVAAVELVDPVVLIDRPVVLGLRSLLQVLVDHACLHVGVVLGGAAPRVQVSMAVGCGRQRRRGVHVAVEWLPTPRRVRRTVEVRLTHRGG
mmetsp:Transcript_36886/g.117392  ORF Transcript_36886/g.117392 Transcript_36886/m.117392 type:complete len:203 (+) Transcript_36886:129-737(+)